MRILRIVPTSGAYSSSHSFVSHINWDQQIQKRSSVSGRHVRICIWIYTIIRVFSYRVSLRYYNLLNDLNRLETRLFLNWTIIITIYYCCWLRRHEWRARAHSISNALPSIQPQTIKTKICIRFFAVWFRIKKTAFKTIHVYNIIMAKQYPIIDVQNSVF